MDTKKFKTKTTFLERDNGQLEDVWEIALDIGYSAVKLFSPNMIARFPSYARRMIPDQRTIGNVPKENIFYQDLDTGEAWCVGESAQSLIALDDTSDSEAALYGRERYGNPMFKVITRCGLGIAMQKNAYGDPSGKRVFVQTGLPPRYMKMDSESLIEAISGRHNFKLKLGSEPWVEYHFEISKDDVNVMSQPMGTLFSVSTNNSHSFIEEAQEYFNKNILVFDPGFGTLDLFPIKCHLVEKSETFDDLGMKRVLKETTDEIFDRYNQEITIPAMQKYLETGTIRCIDKRAMKTKDVPFDDILSEANYRVCMEALNRVTQVCPLYEYDYLIITGGTGAAWNAIIRDYFKDMTTLKIVDGNQNDSLPFVFSNVRGYFMYRYTKLFSEAR